MEYFEQRQMKTLKRLQSMRKTANNKIVDLQERLDMGPTTKATHTMIEHDLIWWRSQYTMICHAIDIVIDPDQLTLWEDGNEAIQG